MREYNRYKTFWTFWVFFYHELHVAKNIIQDSKAKGLEEQRNKHLKHEMETISIQDKMNEFNKLNVHKENIVFGKKNNIKYDLLIQHQKVEPD